MPLPPGTRFGPYEVIAALGAGGMGEVFRASDARLGREVALKILGAELAGDPASLARFEREARAVGALNHPNIVHVFDIGREAGTAYVVMELVDGETLRATLGSVDGSPKPLPRKKACDIAQQIAQALAAAHGRGIVHRDLKPENVMITRDGRVKVLDFGLAKPIARAGDETRAATLQTASGVVLGTFAYMAPEQVRGLEVDHRADIFAFGAVLYEMLSGVRAFKGETAADTMMAVLSTDPPDFDSERLAIPVALERIVRRCLEKRPELRFQSANDLAFALDTLSTASTSSAAAAAPLSASRRPRRRAIAAALGVLALGAAFATGRDTVGRGGSTEPPRFTRLTFRRGWVTNARFAPDGRSVVYSAIWDSEPERVFPIRLERPRAEAQAIADGALAAVSASGDIAIRTQPERRGLFIERGTLAETPLAGGEPRPVLERVDDATYGPDGHMAVVRTVRGRDRLELFPGGTVLYETAGWISSPRFSRDGSRLAFLEHPVDDDNRGWLAILDMATRVKRNATAEFAAVEGLAWSPDGGEVCFGMESTLQCAMANGSAVRVLLRGPLRLVLHDIAADGRILAGGYMIRLAQFVGTSSGHEVDLSWQESPLPIALSHDGARLLFSSAAYDIFLRNVNGRPPLRLGEGMPTSVSYDDRWVLALLPDAPTRLAVVPIGVGETRILPRGAIEGHQWAAWMPDGRIVMAANQKGHATRLFVQDVSGGDPAPITDEGVMLRTCASPVSPDGRVVFGDAPDGSPALYPLKGGSPERLDLLGADLFPIGWSTPDVFYAQSRVLGRQVDVYRVAMTSRTVEKWRTIGPAELAGAPKVFWTIVSADGKEYAYGTDQGLMDLFLIDGLLSGNTAR